jgi:hypothetical protein
MGIRGTRLAGLAGTVIVAAAALTPAPAGAAPRASHAVCAPVSADGVGQDLGMGHTQATLSVAGTQVATSEAFFTIDSTTGSVASFHGPITLTPVVGPGTLVAQVTGTFDGASGEFRATSTSLTGSGPLRKVSGQLTFAGLENLSNGAFTETVSGRLCR